MTHDHTPDANGWMPIETAPNASFRCLGYFPKAVKYPNTRVMGVYGTEQNGIYMMKYKMRDGSWTSKAPSGCCPSHWMPLPQPPETP
jgi:hypothetical protein